MKTNVTLKKALLVEDDPMIQEILVQYLHRNQYNVDTVGSAEAALDNLAFNDYLFIITDLILPGMNGFDLVREIKKRCPDMPIAITTGNASRLNRGLLKMVDNLVLEKPFHSSDFTALLAELNMKRSA